MKKIQEWIGRHRIITSLCGAVLLFGLAAPTGRSILVGLPVVALGEAIRIWSSGHIGKDEWLTVDGPYSLSRNPLYLGNFFLGLGVSVMGRSPAILLLFLIGFYFIYKPTIESEEKKLGQKFGADYIAYCNRVPRFFPSPWRWRVVWGRFEWRRVLGHREHHTWLGIVTILLLLVLRATLTV